MGLVSASFKISKSLSLNHPLLNKLSHIPVLHCLLNTTLAARISAQLRKEIKEVIVWGWRMEGVKEPAGMMRKTTTVRNRVKVRMVWQ